VGDDFAALDIQQYFSIRADEISQTTPRFEVFRTHMQDRSKVGVKTIVLSLVSYSAQNGDQVIVEQRTIAPKPRMKTRFTISVNGSNRTVFAARETRGGDLNIHITSGGRAYSAPTFGDLVAVCDESKFEDCENHISVHASRESSAVNLIKRTQTFPDRTEDLCQVTTGIKQDNLFVPVLFRVCGDLSRDRYQLPVKCADQLESLGAYEPSQGQLRFMAVCSRRGTSFSKDEEHPSNVKEVHFENFTLTVIWSFLNKPSHQQAIDFFLSTKAETGTIRGLHWYEIYNLYTDLYMAHAQEYFKIFGDC
jgi:hypothetical protein